MSGLLARAGRLFVAPPQVAFAPPRSRPSTVGVLASERDLPVAAGAVARRLRREARDAVALVCLWRADDERLPDPPAPAAPTAARLAGRLRERDLAVRALGALCIVDLPAPAGDAVTAARRALAAVELGTVIAAHRRDRAMDALLRTLDRLVLVPPANGDPLLAALALEDLAQLGPPVESVALPGGVLARQAARLGLAGPPAPERPPLEAPA